MKPIKQLEESDTLFKMGFKKQFFIIVILLVIGRNDLSAQTQRATYVGIELGSALQMGNVERTDLHGLRLKNTINPQIRIIANFELTESLYLKSGLGLMTYSTNISFESYSDPVLIREVPNISLGLEKEIVKSGKFKPYLGFDIFINSRPKMNSIEINSPEGARLIPASETENILVHQASITASSSSFIIYLMPSMGINYQINNKILATLFGSYGWNISEPLIVFDYSSLRLNGNAHSFQGSYSGNLFALQVGLRYRLK